MHPSTAAQQAPPITVTAGTPQQPHLGADADGEALPLGVIHRDAHLQKKEGGNTAGQVRHVAVCRERTGEGGEGLAHQPPATCGLSQQQQRQREAGTQTRQAGRHRASSMQHAPSLLRAHPPAAEGTCGCRRQHSPCGESPTDHCARPADTGELAAAGGRLGGGGGGGKGGQGGLHGAALVLPHSIGSINRVAHAAASPASVRATGLPRPRTALKQTCTLRLAHSHTPIIHRSSPSHSHSASHLLRQLGPQGLGEGGDVQHAACALQSQGTKVKVPRGTRHSVRRDDGEGRTSGLQ